MIDGRETSSKFSMRMADCLLLLKSRGRQWKPNSAI